MHVPQGPPATAAFLSCDQQPCPSASPGARRACAHWGQQRPPQHTCMRTAKHTLCPSLGECTLRRAAAPQHHSTHRSVWDEAPLEHRALWIVLVRRAGVHVHRKEVLLLQHRRAALRAQLVLHRRHAQRVAGRRGAAAPRAVACAADGGQRGGIKLQGARHAHATDRQEMGRPGCQARHPPQQVPPGLQAPSYPSPFQIAAHPQT